MTKPAVETPECVTIFGAGVTGLTVAHELVERGFRVQVWEPQGNDRFPERGCDVGGLARTQWTRAHWPEWADLTREPLPRVGRFQQDLWLDKTGKQFEKYQYGLKPESIVLELIKLARFDSGDVKSGTKPVDMYAYYRCPESVQRSIPPDVFTNFEALLGHPDLDTLRVSVAREGAIVTFHRKDNSSIRFHFEYRVEKARRSSVMKGHGARIELYYLPTWGHQTQPIVHLPQRFFFKQNAEPNEIMALGAAGSIDAHAVLQEINTTLLHNPWIEQVYVEMYNRQWETGHPYIYNEAFLTGIRNYFSLEKDFPLGEIGSVYAGETGDRFDVPVNIAGRVLDTTVVRLDSFPAGTPADVELSITYRVRERWFPGEHGYRFFPRFYRHLYDTLDRIPILDTVAKSSIGAAQERAVSVNAEPVKYVETDRTVHDNIVPRPTTALAFKNAKAPTVIGRYRATSLSELSERMGALVNSPDEGGFGFTEADVARYFLRSFQYMTSCTARREELEEISWHDYLESDSYSPSARDALSKFPKALVAMDGKESDARTVGSVGTQTGMDQLNPKEAQDGALNGPTSEAWFGHWRRYLEAQGVEFIHGELVGLNKLPTEDGKEIVWPEVNCFEPRLVSIDKEGKVTPPPLMPGYFVVALPVQEAQKIAQRAGDISHRDLETLANFDLPGELKKFVGIQFYFWEDLYWIDGHVYFPDSPWALTSISQTRKWADRPDWEHGYRGVLSVIIGQWEAPGDFVGHKASECSPDEIAKEVWLQVRRALERDVPLPRPLYFHIDDNLTPPTPEQIEARDGSGATAATDLWQFVYEYQVQSPGRWKKRPGDLGEVGYSVEHGIVLAGTYMKHHTRITSMEAANESARHAVNAILEDCSRDLRTTPCSIWPIEENELPDLEPLKKLDAKLYARGLPHYLEILGLDELTRELLRRPPRHRFDPTHLFEHFTKLADPRGFFGFDLRPFTRSFP